MYIIEAVIKSNGIRFERGRAVWRAYDNAYQEHYYYYGAHHPLGAHHPYPLLE